MKSFYNRLVAVLPILFSLIVALQAQSPQTFNYTGALQTFKVPDGVSMVHVIAFAATGGDGQASNNIAIGGKGGKVEADLAVTPGQTLNIYVGGKGTKGGAGGFNGGGGTGANFGPNGSGSGGGATDIRIGGTDLSNRVLVAGGGGGGASGFRAGGAGGGLTGAAGVSGGGGGTAAAGGSAGGGGSAGTLGAGGGGNGVSCGGGGYYGGGSAAASQGGGGGGSSYTDPTLCSNVVHTQGANDPDSHGYLTLSWTEAPPCVFVPADISVAYVTGGIFGFAGPSYAPVVYTPSGTQNGAPKWVNTFDYDIRWTGVQWAIYHNDVVVAATNNTGSITNLPCTGWVVDEDYANGITLSGGCGSLLPPTVTPSVIISANPGNNIPPGTSVTFTAMPTNGGTTPGYQWKKNNTDVGTNSSTYMDNALATGDVITVEMSSDDPCSNPATATSNTITMTVCSNPVVVQNTDDSGAGSLRQAIMDACAGATITFDPSVFGSAQTITLTSGHLNIEKNLTIIGPGADKLTVNQTAIFSSVFTIQNDKTVNISGMKMTGASFGSVTNFGGTVALSNCELSNNTGSSAAVYNSTGTMSLTDCTLKNNSGGGIINYGTLLTATNCEISGNSGSNHAVYNSTGTMTLTDCTIKDNTSGGIINYGTELNVTNCQIMDNTKTGSSGAGIYVVSGTLHLSGSTISGNSGSEGAGIINYGTVIASNTRIVGNTSAGNGGGVYHSSNSMTLTHCTIANNNAVGGAGIYSFGDLTMTGSTVSNNTSSGSFNGGGISAHGGSLMLTNCTISGNQVTDVASGTNAGGLWMSVNSTITSCTITGNSASASNSAGGVYKLGGTATFKNTIIAGNTGTNGANPDLYTFDSFSSDGYNLIGDGTGGSGFTGTADIVGTSGSPINAMLGPLADNGGPTQTHALLSGSPAMDSGHAFGLSTDQRGLARTADDPSLTNAADGTDIGAVEMACPTPTAYVLTGGGNSCDGGVSIILDNSETGVMYQLKKDGADIGSSVEGIGNTLDFGDYYTESGTYTVVATRNGWGCTADMTGNVKIRPCFTGLGNTYCSDDNTPYPLEGINGVSRPSKRGSSSSNSNGTFSGPGVVDNGDGTATFTPSEAGTGGTVTYTVGSTSTSQNVAVYLCGLSPSFSGLDASYCDLDEAVTLVGNYAPKGFFQGPGITDNGDGTATFDPGAALLGENTVRYLLTENINAAWANIAAGSFWSLGIKSDGTLWAWGYNNGTFGDGTSNNSDVPIQVGTDNDWYIVSSGNSHALALKTDGTLWAWGENLYGELGIGNDIPSNVPLQVGMDNDWLGISAGLNFSAALKTDGTLWTWGANSYGQLGDGTVINKNVPEQVGTDTDWKTVRAGNHFTLALKTDGTMWSWGYNDNGRLGLGPVGNQYTPQQIGTDNDWSKISTNNAHSLALKNDATLWVWGKNNQGELGRGTISYGESTPFSLGSGWAEVSTGPNFSFAIKTDGTLWASGNNQGIFGNGSNSNSSTFVQIGTDSDWQNVFCGFEFSLKLKNDATLYSSGYNGAEGLLGNGSNEDYSADLSKVVTAWFTASTEVSKCPSFTNLEAEYCSNYGIIDLVGNYAPEGTFSGLGVTDNGDGTASFDPSAAGTGSTITYEVYTGQPWEKVSAGYYHTLAIRADGTLWAWGNNDYEVFGDGTDNSSNVPVQAGTDTDWSDVSAGYYHSLGVKVDGTLWGWGYDDSGEIGGSSSNVPAQIGSDSDWADVEAGYYRSFGIKTDGTLWAWGYNEGVLGTGNNSSASVPVQISTATNWVSVSTHSYGDHVLALRADGTLWAWGDNDYGQLGTGTNSNSNLPLQVGTDTDWQKADASPYHSLAIKTDGTLWTWGYNGYGELGNGTTDDSNLPVLISNGWADVAGGDSYSLGVKTDGTRWGWGYNGYGNLGNGTEDDSDVPVQADTETNWSTVYATAGEYFSFALKNDGNLFGFGYNDYGYLGDGTEDDSNTPVQVGDAILAVSATQTVSILIAPNSIELSNISASDCKNTTCTDDDTFTADVTVNYDIKPGGGTLALTGPNIVGTVAPVDVSEIGTGSYTFTGVTMKANGADIELTAAFSEGCDMAANLGTSPRCFFEPYVPTDIVLNSADCSFINGSYLPSGTQNGAPRWVNPNNNIDIFWNGSAWIIGIMHANYTGSVTELPCSTGWEGCGGATLSGGCGSLAGTTTTPDCAITDISIGNMGNCNDNGTTTATDDYFVAGDVAVTFAYAPSSGNLVIKRGSTVLGTKSAAELSCVTEWLFLNVQMAADGLPLGITAEFTGTDCTLMKNFGNAPASCSCVPTSAFTTCPGSQSVNVDAGKCFATVNYAPEANGIPAPSYEYAFTGASNGFGGGSTLLAEFNLGVTNLKITATNACGTVDCNITVTVVDNQAPTITCPIDRTVNADAGQCSSVQTYTVTNTDNCSSTVSQTAGLANGAAFPLGVTTNAFTATDGASLNSACSFKITVVDNQAPTITCPIDRTVNADAGQCSSVQTYTVTNTDNCSSTVSQTAGLANGTAFPVGVTTNAFTATDGAGLNSACSFKITVVDNQPPSITCPDNRTVNADAGQCSSVQSYIVTATDNCSNYTLERTNGFSSGSPFPLGFNVVNWKVTDVGGNSSACSFSITVLDAELPTISCPSDISRNNDPGQCTAVVNYVVNASDNCGGWSLSRTSGLASGSSFPSGTTTVSWKNTDTGGNSVNCSFTVTVTESQAPTISCPANIVKTAGADCQSQVFYVVAGLNDNCPGVSAGFDSSSPTAGLVSGSSFPTGTSTVVLKATDAGGLTASCSFTVTINDNLAPTISCPANRTVNTDAGQCYSVQTYTVTATDNCSGATATRTSGLASGSNFPKGITNVVWRATDAGGRTATCQFRVTVNDRQAPTISCPSDQMVSTDAGLCSAVVTYANATFVDNCTGGTVTKISGPNSGAAFPRGATNVIFRATDAAGNSALCSIRVTVSDGQAPSISCPSNIARNNDANVCNAVVTYATPTGTDNCAGVQVNLLSGLASGSVFQLGSTTNVWRAMDGIGQTSTCSFTVTISDAQLPTISCPPPTAVSGSGSPCGYPKSQLPNPTASDNCAVISLTSDAPTTLPAGPTTITWTAKDAANNARTCAYVVTVNCGTAARDEERDEVGRMKYEERYELGSMKYDAERESPSSLILHPSSLTLVPNPASDIVVITLSNQQINSTSNQQHSGSNQQINSASNQQHSGSNQQINSASNQQLLLHDALGRQVWARKLDAAVEQIKIDLTAERIGDGVYQISWVTEEGVITKSLVVAKR